MVLVPTSKAPSLVVQETVKLSSTLLAFSPLESVLFPGGLLLESIYKHEVWTLSYSIRIQRGIYSLTYDNASLTHPFITVYYHGSL